MRAGRRSSRASRDLRHPSRHDLWLREPGELRAVFAAAGAAERRRTAIDLALGRDPAAAGRAHGAARLLRDPYRERPDRGRTSQFADRFPLAGLGLAPPARSRGAESAHGSAFATRPSRPPASVPTSPVGYVFASSLVPVLAPLTAYAAPSFPPGGGVLSGAVDLMSRIRNDFKYDSKATVISTPLGEVFEKRHGVCQDFAHVMIAGLRGLGLPAAYVSGYLRTIPPPVSRACRAPTPATPGFRCGAGPRLGWIGFDPTNDLLVGNGHIMLAVGQGLLRRLAGRRHHRRIAQAETRRRRGCAAGRVSQPAAAAVSGFPLQLSVVLRTGGLTEALFFCCHHGVRGTALASHST